MLIVRLRQHDAMRPWWWFYILSLVFLVIYMVTATVAHWVLLNDIERIAFPALGLLGWYMLFRGWQSFMEWYVPFEGWEARLVGHVGFNLISMLEGFIIVAAIDLRSPAWLVAILAIAGAVGGSIFVGRLRSRYPEPKPS
jgi:hypothetical protein